MHIRIAPASDLPIYRQIMRQVVDAIAGAQLRPGERLPSHRELSESLVIAPLTVKKAYDELEAQGYLASQQGRGTFVADTLPKVSRAEQTAGMKEAARALVSQARLAGVPLAEVVQLVKDVDHAMSHPPLSRQSRRTP